MALTDNEILDRYRKEPAPLLAVLHAFHDRDGHLSDDTLRTVASGLRIPIADLFGTVTFYHHFSREPGGLRRKRVCAGPICARRGAAAILAETGGTAMPCSGRCDDPVPVLEGHTTLIGGRASALAAKPSPVPVANPGGYEECLFRYIREPDQASLVGYRSRSGYKALEHAVAENDPDSLIETVTRSGLAGRGGAGFPTGRKWRAVRDAPGEPKTVICNADEGEPGCFKDRAIMDHDPHALVEGMALAAFAAGAARAFIYLRYEYPETQTILDRAIEEAVSAGLIGPKGLVPVTIYLRRGAGAYICGEEGSLINSLEGKHPFPRNRPPFPVTHGFENKPTIVNNVETLAAVPKILLFGAEWYRSLGLGEHGGTKIISLSGDVCRPGNYEIPIGLPLQTLLNDWAGGPHEGRAFQAVTMAGLSGGFLAGADLETTLDDPAIKPRGSFLGAGGIMVFDDSRDMVAVAAEAMGFFAEESCGKCFPCRIGTQRLTERLRGEAGPRDTDTWIDEVTDIGRTMKSVSACGLGIAAPLVTESLVRYFPTEIEKHLERARS